MSGLVGLGDVAGLLRRVLPLPWMYRLARLHGTAVWLLRSQQRRAVARNLAPFAAGDAELRKMTRRFFQLRQSRVLMLLLFLEMSPSERQAQLEIEGLEHLDHALARGRGAILLGSHLNSLGVFMSIMVLRQRGYAVELALPSDAEVFPTTRVGQLLRRKSARPSLNEELGGFFVQFNVRPIVKRLAQNVVVAQTGDGWHSTAFTTVPFLGRMLPFTTGMMSVARSTGAMVVPFNVVGAPPELRCAMSEPLDVPRGDDAAADLGAAVATYAARLEHDLLQNVACWEHWLIEDTLDTMGRWPERPLRERLEIE